MKKSLSILLSFTLLFQTTIQQIAFAYESAASEPVSREAFTHTDDTDEDGLTDLEETILGTDPEREDSDFDDLTDKWELDNGLDPLDPDVNDDGMIDYQEVVLDGELMVGRDSDFDGTPNVHDDDNDNDGVRDGLDISPYSRTGVEESFAFNLKTSGKPTYFDFNLRPENPEHLKMAHKNWDWPDDERGQMQDMDKTREDLKIIPVLEMELDDLEELFSSDKLDEMKDYGISVAGNKAHLPLIPVKDDGATVALRGRMFFPETDSPLDIDLSTRLVWLVYGTSDKSDLDWTSASDEQFASAHDGGGMVFHDIDQNGIKDAILMGVIDRRHGYNQFQYRIGWNMDAYGNPSGGWSMIQRVSPDKDQFFGDEHAGGGAAVGNFDDDPRPDLVLMAVADTGGDNEFVYMIGWNLNSEGVAESWSDVVEESSGADNTDGGGVVAADFNGDGEQDLLLMVVNDVSGENHFQYKIGWSIDDTGEPESWSSARSIDRDLAKAHIGAGAAYGDLNGDGNLELVFMGSVNEEVLHTGSKAVHQYIVGTQLDLETGSASWSDVLECNADKDWGVGKGAGTAIAQLNDSGPSELIFMGISHQEDGDDFYMRVGWDIENNWNPGNEWGDTISGPDDTIYYADLSDGGADIGHIIYDDKPDIVFAGLSEGQRQIYYRIRLSLDAYGGSNVWKKYSKAIPNPDPLPSNWDRKIDGCGAALGDIDNNGDSDLVLMYIESYGSEEFKRFKYMIGWNFDKGNEEFSSWSDPIAVEGVGTDIAGGGAALYDIDGNNTPELLLTGYKNPDESDGEFLYRIGWNLKSDGEPNDGWSDVKSISSPGLTEGVGGAGASISDVDKNGRPDLLLMKVGNEINSTQKRDFQYLLVKDLDKRGNASAIPAPVSLENDWDVLYGQIGGAAIGDMDRDGILDCLLLGGVKDYSHFMGFKYRVFHSFGNSGWGFPFGTETGSDMGDRHAGGGTAVADIDGNGVLDQVVMGVENNNGDYDFVYRIDWNLNADGAPSHRSAPMTAEGVGCETQGAGAAIGYINDNDLPDLLFMGVASPDDGKNQFRYRIGWDMGPDGVPVDWSGILKVQVFNRDDYYLANDNAGGGAALADLNGNDRPDLVLMAITDGSGTNNFHHGTTLDLGYDGVAQNQIDHLFTPEGVGSTTEGGGVAIVDLNENGTPEFIFMGIDDPSGNNGLRYRIGWDIDDRFYASSNWSRTIKPRESQLSQTNHGGGATAGDLDDDGKKDLIFLSIDEQEGPDEFNIYTARHIQTESTCLARYPENFIITGFSVQENHGSKVGVFHSLGDRDETGKIHVYLDLEYMNSQTPMEDAFEAMKSDPANLDVSGEIKQCAHQDESVKAVSDSIRTLLGEYSNKTQFPVVFAITDRSAAIHMDKFTESSGVEYSSSSFTVDFTNQEQSVDPMTTRSLKMSWYDFTAIDPADDSTVHSLDFESVISIAENWDLTDEELENAVKQLLIWNMGEARLTKVGELLTHPTLADDYVKESMGWVGKASAGLGALASIPARVQGFAKLGTAWNKAGIGFRQASKAGVAYYNLVRGKDVAGGSMSRLYKAGIRMNRNMLGRFSTLSRISNALSITGAILSAGTIIYSSILISRQQGWSDFGAAAASINAAYQTTYFAVLAALVSFSPLVGAVLVALIAVSDVITTIFKGSGWSQIALEKLIDSLTDVYMVTGVDLETLSTWTRVRDTENNGLTAGDIFFFGAQVNGVAYDIRDATSDNLDDTYITARVYFKDNPDEYYSKIIEEKDFSGSRWDIRETEAWLELEDPEINRKVEAVMSGRYQLVYRKCLVASCGDEYKRDSYSSDIDFYLDVLPDSLDDLASWNEIALVNNPPWTTKDEYDDIIAGEAYAVSDDVGVLANDNDDDPGDDLTATLTTQAEHGVVSLNLKGGFTYTPTAAAPPYFGTDRFTYTAKDTNGLESEEVEVTLIINRSNTAPVAGNFSLISPEDLPVDIQVLDNVVDGDGDPLTVAIATQPKSETDDYVGTVVNHGTHVTFTPEENWTGTATFSYVADDGRQKSNPAEVAIKVFWVNDPPKTTTEKYLTDEDITLIIPAANPEEIPEGFQTEGVLDNDWDEEGKPVTAHLTDDVQPKGTVALNLDGSFTYEPFPNFYGEDSFSYVARDDAGDSDPVIVTIQVDPVNDVPIAYPDSYYIIEDSGLFRARWDEQGVLLNDKNVDGELEAVLVEDASSGDFHLDRLGGFTFFPERNFVGDVTFTYKASNGVSESQDIQVVIKVLDAYDQPLALDDEYTLDGDTVLTVAFPGVLKNDIVNSNWIYPFGTQGVDMEYNGINDPHEIVGTTNLDGGGKESYFSWTDVPLNYPADADTTVAQGINDHGAVVGTYERQGLSGGFTAILDGSEWTVSSVDIPGAEQVFSMGIDDSECHVGYYVEEGSTWGYLYNGDYELQLAGIAGWMPRGISKCRRIVGFAAVEDGFESYDFDANEDSYSIVKIPFADTRVYGINDSGIIVGSFTYPDGTPRSFAAIANPDGGYYFSELSGPHVATGINDNNIVCGYRTFEKNGEIYSVPLTVFSNHLELYPFTAFLADEPEYGDVTFNPDGSFTYVLKPGYECLEGEDRFTYYAGNSDDQSNIAEVVIQLKRTDFDGDGHINCLDPDDDGDGHDDGDDNCPWIYNPDQNDEDSDGIGDVCDNCPAHYNPDQEDKDGDGLGYRCDFCLDFNKDFQCDDEDDCPDDDRDNICDYDDNCPDVFNPDQADFDGDEIGDACDDCNDWDWDLICDPDDNCVYEENEDQADADSDGVGDACDNCPDVFNPDQKDDDGDWDGNACDDCTDADNDGVCDHEDNCPGVSNPGQGDHDGDGLGDACDADVDFGDAPDSAIPGSNYPTLLINSGAEHVLGSDVYLGHCVDSENDGLPSANADGDDLDSGDKVFGDCAGGDEDGVEFTTDIIVGASAQVSVTANADCALSAWIDFNRDGDWSDFGEEIFTGFPISGPGTHSLDFTVPDEAVTGDTYARFRCTTDGAVGFAGKASDGEVEDYPVTISLDKTPVAGFDHGLAFDGEDDHVIVADDASLRMGTGGFTIEGWFASDGDLVQDAVIFHKGDSETVYGLRVLADGGARGGMKSGSESTFASYGETTEFDDGKWCHFALTVDKTNHVQKMYVNGVQVGETTDISGFAGNTDCDGDGFIGVREDGQSFAQGVFDEIRVWNMPRSRTEIMRHMHLSLQADEPGLVAYWNFDEEYGSTANDKTAFRNHGTLMNMDALSWTDVNDERMVKFGTNGVEAVSGVLPAHDNDNDALTFQVVTDPGKGVLEGLDDSSGSFAYTPNQSGEDSIEYRVTDGVHFSQTKEVRIVNNGLAISITDGPIDENGGIATITAQLHEILDKDVTAELLFSGDATGEGTDYTASSSTILIPAGETADEITITAVDDALDEEDETVIIDLDSVSNVPENGEQQVAVVITDNDSPPTVQFTSAGQSGAENGGAIVATVELSAISGKQVTLPFTVGGDAEGAGVDYTVTASPLIVNPGDSEAVITIVPVDESVFELDETVILTLGEPVNASASGIVEHTATIINDEAPVTVGFTSAEQQANEDEGVVVIRARLSGLSAFNVSVPFTVDAASTATGGGVDYSVAPSPLTISAGDDDAELAITIIDDSADEPDETVIVDMGTPVNASVGTVARHTLTIMDMDEPPAQAYDDFYSVNEDARLDIPAPGVLENDADFDEASLAAVKVTEPNNGALTLNNDGSFSYVPHENWNGDDSFTYKAEDGKGNSENAKVTITAIAVNDPPQNSVPADQAVLKNHPLVFSGANGNPIGVSDVDAGDSEIRIGLSARNGTLTLSDVSGVDFSCGQCTGDGNQDQSMIFAGTLSGINQALDGLAFDPEADYTGKAIISLTAEDQGATGGGTTGVDTDIVIVNVNEQMIDIQVEKQIDNDSPAINDTVVYTIKTSNLSDATVLNVSVQDLLPDELSLLSANASQGQYDKNSGIWTVGDMAPARSATLELSVQIVFAGNIENSAELIAVSPPDINPENDIQSVSVTVDDNDGISEDMENRAPNNGDGNNDGVPDSQQPDVASIPSAGGNGYITIQTDSSCGAIEKVHACLEQSLSEDPEYACPLGLVGFEIPCSPARMKVFFYGLPDGYDYTYRKYGPLPEDWLNPVWYRMENVVITPATINGIPVITAEFTLYVGQKGDDTPDLPIVDVGGIAYRNTAAIPAVSGWSIVLIGFLLSLAALWTRRRPRQDGE